MPSFEASTAYILTVALASLFTLVVVWHRQKIGKPANIWIATGVVGLLFGCSVSFAVAHLLGYELVREGQEPMSNTTVAKDLNPMGGNRPGNGIVGAGVGNQGNARMGPGADGISGSPQSMPSGAMMLGPNGASGMPGMGGMPSYPVVRDGGDNPDVDSSWVGTGVQMAMGGGAKTPRDELASMVRKLALATEGIHLELSSKQSQQIKEMLIELAAKKELTDADAEVETDALTRMLTTEQRDILNSFSVQRDRRRGNKKSNPLLRNPSLAAVQTLTDGEAVSDEPEDEEETATEDSETSTTDDAVSAND